MLDNRPDDRSLDAKLYGFLGNVTAATRSQSQRFLIAATTEHQLRLLSGSMLTSEANQRFARARRRFAENRNYKHSDTSRVLDRLLSASPVEGLRPIVKKPGFVGATVKSTGGFAPIWAASADDCLPDDQLESTTDLSKAQFAKKEARRYQRLADAEKIWLYVHPRSALYFSKDEKDDRSEAGVICPQATELCCQMLLSSDPAWRAAGQTFRCAAILFDWPKGMTPAEAAAKYTPEATYTFRGEQVQVFLPMAFNWLGVEAIAEFVRRLRRRLHGKNLRIYCPGLLAHPHHPTHVDLP